MQPGVAATQRRRSRAPRPAARWTTAARRSRARPAPTTASATRWPGSEHPCSARRAPPRRRTRSASPTRRGPGRPRAFRGRRANAVRPESTSELPARSQRSGSGALPVPWDLTKTPSADRTVSESAPAALRRDRVIGPNSRAAAVAPRSIRRASTRAEGERVAAYTIVTGTPGSIRAASHVIALVAKRTQPCDTALPSCPPRFTKP